ncbi:MAG TPA: OmpH family outer membrane protein [Pyrinomonadaceae bacterium]|jgi:Skp family chaperone for outer membrane proteins|nr:OmpH family outer membrane protein [Pyrinomonadaceae bacterium]
MKIVRLIAAVALLTTVAIISVSAQQQQPKPGPTTAPAASAPQANVAVPDSKLAMIYSDAFLDPKTGIARFNSLLTTLNREFQPRQTELQSLQQKINTLSKEIDDTQNVAAPDSIRQKRDQLAQMNTDFKRKGEDAEAAYNKRRGEIFLPLQQDIGKALEVFAKARGITVIVDGSQVPVVYAADSIDITRAFISDFNSKNPATASVSTP